MITKKDYDAMLIERHGQQVFDTLAKAHVGIAGLGGLGSNIAMMLARSGVGHLLLIDFDRVEPSNLNRQHYMVSHLGMPKSEAIKDLVLQANPFSWIHAVFGLPEKTRRNFLKTATLSARRLTNLKPRLNLSTVCWNTVRDFPFSPVQEWPVTEVPTRFVQKR